MPEMNGVEFMKAFIKFNPKTKFIFISGYPKQYLLNNDLLPLNVNFIQKPFKIEELLKKVRKILSEFE